eukprot:6928159-Prymnesium_polylepis.1
MGRPHERKEGRPASDGSAAGGLRAHVPRGRRLCWHVAPVAEQRIGARRRLLGARLEVRRARADEMVLAQVGDAQLVPLLLRELKGAARQRRPELWGGELTAALGPGGPDVDPPQPGGDFSPRLLERPVAPQVERHAGVHLAPDRIEGPRLVHDPLWHRLVP